MSIRKRKIPIAAQTTLNNLLSRIILRHERVNDEDGHYADDRYPALMFDDCRVAGRFFKRPYVLEVDNGNIVVDVYSHIRDDIYGMAVVTINVKIETLASNTKLGYSFELQVAARCETSFTTECFRYEGTPGDINTVLAHLRLAIG
jgi:hypothetical protein